MRRALPLLLVIVGVTPNTAKSQSRILTTYAGTDNVFTGDGLPATSVALGRVASVRLDSQGRPVFTDPAFHLVFTVDGGNIKILAGNNIQGLSTDITASQALSSSGGGYSGDGGPAVLAALNVPMGAAYDAAGNLYIADTGNNRIRIVTPDGTISTFAGTGQAGFNGDGPATSVSLRFPRDVAVDAAGIVYINDWLNYRIRKVSNGMMTTIAGNGQSGDAATNVAATSAPLDDVEGLAVDSSGTVYISEFHGNRVRKITAAGQLVIVAGTGTFGYSGDGGNPLNAQLASPGGVAVNSGGDIIISDTGNEVIRKISGNVITTIAGVYNQEGISPDGIPAAQAVFTNPFGLAVSSNNEIYIADRDNFRIRKISGDATVSTVAGNGRLIRLRDGGPATLATLVDPFGVTVDPNGGLFIADTDNSVVRHVDASQTLATVTGSGWRQCSGDGGLTVQAGLSSPVQITLDSANDFFIVDEGSCGPGGTVRKATSSGTISGFITGLDEPTQVAFDSSNNMYIAESGKNQIDRVSPSGAATVFNQTPLSQPTGIAFDAVGNLYVTEFGAGKVTRIAPDGTSAPFAGGGQISGTAIDGAPALSVKLLNPAGITVDSQGNVYFSDAIGGRVYQVTSGTIHIVAGNGRAGYAGDGGLATNATLNLPWGLSLDTKSGNLYIADVLNNRIRAALPISPGFNTTTDTLTLTAAAGGAVTDALTVGLTSSFAGLLYSTQTSGEVSLQVTPTVGTMPGSLQIQANPTGLAPGMHQGMLSILAPGANPPIRTVTVNLNVSAAQPTQLAVDIDRLNLSFVTGDSAVTRQISVKNTGGGSLAFSPSVNVSGTPGWLQIAQFNSPATPNTPGYVVVQVDPSSLAEGTYTGSIVLTGSGASGVATIPINVTVTSTATRLQLSQQGLTFNVVAGGGAPLPQTVYVFNAGQGSMEWTATPSVTSAVTNWLSISATSGTVAQPNADLSPVDISAAASGLTPGTYYGSVNFSPTADSNQLQSVTVVLNVLPQGSTLPPQVAPNALVFTGTAGQSPGAQQVMISTLGNTSVSYNSSRITSDGQNWLISTPTASVVSPNQPGRIVVQPDYTSLQPGQYSGKITVFVDGASEDIAVLSLVTPSATAGTGAGTTSAAAEASSACTPKTLTFSLLNPANPPSTALNAPTNLTTQVYDDCTNPVTNTNGAVVASFSNQDPTLQLSHVGSGKWSKNWQPSNVGMNQSVQVTVTAFETFANGRVVADQHIFQVGIQSVIQSAPLFTTGGVVNAASFSTTAPVAPGELITIFGTTLSDGSGTPAGAIPFPTQLAGAQVQLGNRLLPVLYASDTQLNVQVPYDIPVNTQVQLSVAHGDALSVPQQLTVAQAEPAIFTVNQTGTGQGAIVDGTQVADQNAPAHVGDIIVIYCNGLGPVNPPIPPGTAATGATPTVQTVTTTIGGLPATVNYAGLSPGSPGLYQVNAIVPSGVSPGGQVPVTLTVAGQTSPPVTIAVQ
jgi:uncharacterized protein (TIGR03437 family)